MNRIGMGNTVSGSIVNGSCLVHKTRMRARMTEARQDMVKVLCHLFKDRSVTVIAEGVETPDEAKVCKRLGCHLGQGYLFGVPQAAKSFGG